VSSSQRWTFLTIVIIYSDLNKEQKELINNYYSKKIKLVRYFIWTYEQDTSAHEKIQGKIVYR
jgi:hypothetical protein